MKLIGLIGRKQSGKDTVCHLIDQLIPRVRRLAFADGVKEEVAEAIGQPVDFVEANKTQLRLLLQAWGTDWRRDMCSNSYWVDRVRDQLRDIQHTDTTVILTDVRFPNEAAVVREFGGVVARVFRPGFDKTDDVHPSETALDNYEADNVIWNAKGIPALQKNVSEFLTTIGLLEPIRTESEPALAPA